ncbi:YwqG family protein [Clostridium oceanicum]|uniref:YwqG family protein n=1 Tax=Clostridium oceanicum TaxID=1543 RepID=A0ABN1JK55_9CLOT
MDLNSLFDEIKKNAIKVNLKTYSKEDLPIGASKFGGKPDVPKDFKWFYYKGEGLDCEIKSRPLSFLAQINCEEMKEYDEDGLLPKKGILYFFYELSSLTWGCYPQDKGSAKVFYFDGDVKELNRTNFPDDMEENFKLPEIQLDFSKKYDLPDYEEFTELYHYDNWDYYDEIRVLKGYEQEELDGKLLGYADLVQAGMLRECEKGANGIHYSGLEQIPDKKLKQLEKNCSQWQLLFQLSSIMTKTFELMFDDCGVIYFYIRKEDLKKRNFDNCWLILQCC